MAAAVGSNLYTKSLNILAKIRSGTSTAMLSLGPVTAS